MSSIQLNFNESLGDFNSSTRSLTIPITVSWQPPAQLYGVLVRYSVSVQSSLGVSVYQDSSVGASTTSIMAVVMVIPAEVYLVTVNVTTGGGSSSSASNFTAPEAGWTQVFSSKIVVLYISLY